MPEVIGVQFIKGGLVHYYYPMKEEQSLGLNEYCVVDTEQGIHLAKVVHPSKKIEKQHLPEKIKSVMRRATDKDKEQFNANLIKEKDAYKLCRQKGIEKKLAMKLVDVSYSLDARKAVFYFTAENRVDFRELVKDLAHALKVKIEMRQIGVRDEARRLGGVGCCGRSLCCCTFLKDFVSVSIRMAKEQNLSLNPTKVSGLCGRLMCCLSYEYEGKNKNKKSDSMDESIVSDGPIDINANVDERYVVNCDCSKGCENSCTLKEQGVDPGETSIDEVPSIIEEKEMTGAAIPVVVKGQEVSVPAEQVKKEIHQEGQKQDQKPNQNPGNKRNKRRPHHNKHRRFKNSPENEKSQDPKPPSSGN